MLFLKPKSSVSVFALFYRYYRFNEQTRAVDSGYPKPMNTWSGAPDNIKAAIMSEDGCRFSGFTPVQIFQNDQSKPGVGLFSFFTQTRSYFPSLHILLQSQQILEIQQSIHEGGVRLPKVGAHRLDGLRE